MIIKAIILSTILTCEYDFVLMSPVDKVEARTRRGKSQRDRRRGGGGLR
jgi:hypothetical protein